MVKVMDIEIEKGIRLLSRYLPISNRETRKPILFHDIRVGMYLYEHGYSRNIILGGILHDALEFSEITEQLLEQEFGEVVTRLVRANTKDDSIANHEMKTTELIQRCIKYGEDALIIKAADILDSLKFYTRTENKEQIQYCLRNIKAIFEFKPTEFKDKIFNELMPRNG